MTELLQAKKVLVIGAGGGNDSFSCFMLLSHLKEKGFNPDHIDVAAMLPSCLEYVNVSSTEHPLICEIHPTSSRKAGHKEMQAFPEKMLSKVKDDLPFKKVSHIYGIHMSKGSMGVLSALTQLVELNAYDLIFAVDVGGDFITEDENIGVLSPQMDGYVGWALQQLEKTHPVLYAVFGLGTDGESTSHWLHKALTTAQPYIVEKSVIDANNKDVQKVIDLYRRIVEPNRYSRTTDYTIKELTGALHENPSLFRCRLHVLTSEQGTKKFYATYMHEQSSEFYGQYVLLSSINFVTNRYCVPCTSAQDWVKKVHKFSEKINHEMCGQTEGGVYYCLPSWRFSETDRAEIVDLALKALSNEWYKEVVFYSSDVGVAPQGLVKIEMSDNLILVRKERG